MVQASISVHFHRRQAIDDVVRVEAAQVARPGWLRLNDAVEPERERGQHHENREHEPASGTIDHGVASAREMKRANWASKVPWACMIISHASRTAPCPPEARVT